MKFLWILLSKKLAITPNINPRIGPPPESIMNFSKIYHAFNSSPCTINYKTAKTTIAVPSFRRLSPSIIVDNYFGAPSSLSSATTATGSVADTMAP
jgi:hypothetical protein